MTSFDDLATTACAYAVGAIGGIIGVTWLFVVCWMVVDIAWETMKP